MIIKKDFNFFDLMKVWWAFSWRSLIIVPIVFGLIFVYSFLITVSDFTNDSMLLLFLILGISLGIISLIYITRFWVNKDYGNFKLIVSTKSEVNEIQPTKLMYINIFWSYIWRSFLCNLPLTLIMYIFEMELLKYEPMTSIFSSLISCVVGILVFKLIMNKDYGNFRLIAIEK